MADLSRCAVAVCVALGGLACNGISAQTVRDHRSGERDGAVVVVPPVSGPVNGMLGEHPGMGARDHRDEVMGSASSPTTMIDEQMRHYDASRHRYRNDYLGRYKSPRIIVSIGDSFASGEGNPKECGLRRAVQSRSGAASPGVAPSFRVETVRQPIWLDARAHRSAYNPSAMAVSDLANRIDSGQPILYLNFASSGAELVHAYAKSQHGQRNGGQIDEVFQALGSRRIDDLIVSFGGNDVNFAPSLFSLTANGISLGVEDLAVLPLMLDLAKSITGSASRGKVQSDFPRLEARLLDRMREFEEHVSKKLNVKTIHWVEYPEGLFSRAKGVDAGGCGVFYTTIAPSVSATDAVLIRQLGSRLNMVIKSFIAEANGRSPGRWRYVEGVADDFDGHGYCANATYYVSFDKSKACQFDVRGTMHPNMMGMKKIATRIRNSLLRQE